MRDTSNWNEDGNSWPSSILEYERKQGENYCKSVSSFRPLGFRHSRPLFGGIIIALYTVFEEIKPRTLFISVVYNAYAFERLPFKQIKGSK